MSREIRGIHHITAIAGDPQQNIDFYAGLLGLRLIKLTVNYDDPLTYHLYYGDGYGHPGTILTFFPWPGAAKGRQGNGQVTVTAFSVPSGALTYWVERLTGHDVKFEGPYERFQEQVISFSDHDGLRIELVSGPPVNSERGWQASPVPPEYAIHGFHSASPVRAAASTCETARRDAKGRNMTTLQLGWEFASEREKQCVYAGQTQPATLRREEEKSGSRRVSCWSTRTDSLLLGTRSVNHMPRYLECS